MFIGYEAPVAIILLLLLFAAFIQERYPPEVIAATGAAVFIVLGFVPTDQVMAAFSNPAPITIAAMFVMSGALVRTGLLDAFANALVNRARERPWITTCVFLLSTLAASAFVNNTPIVLVLIPVVLRLANAIDLAPTRLLIPLSYTAIMGGTCSLIGTSTNLLVDGISRDLELRPFGIFEIAPVGLIVATSGGLTLLVLGRFLLPDRRTSTVESVLVEQGFLSEVTIKAGSDLIGRTVGDVSLLQRPGIRLTGLRTGKVLRHADFKGQALHRGDTLIMVISTAELLTLRENRDLSVGLRRSVEPSLEGSVIAEAVVAPARHHTGERLADLMLGRRFGLRVLGVHRHGHVAGEDLSSVRLRAADKLIIEGPPAGFDALMQSGLLVSITRAGVRAYRRRKAPIALMTLLAVVLLAALDVMTIGILAMLGVVVILLLRCIDSDEAWSAIDGSILILIFSMLIVGEGLNSTGAVNLIVNAVSPWLVDQSPMVTLIVVYALASILTELVTNNAVAVVLTPVVIGLATHIGIDPRPLVVAVMFGASASFASPIGYQTNTLVYGAGHYRFTDFMRIGIPMNVVVGTACVLTIPVFFPF